MQWLSYEQCKNKPPYIDYQSHKPRFACFYTHLKHCVWWNAMPKLLKRPIVTAPSLRMKLTFAIMVTSLIVLSASGNLLRQKRFLVYSTAVKYQLIFGTGLPIHLEGSEVVIGWVIKSAYLLPQNATFYTDPYMIRERRRSIGKPGKERYDLYKLFEERTSKFLGQGRSCLLKAICESAKLPYEEAGLMGEIFRVFFTPSSTEEMPETGDEKEYHIAEHHGLRNGINCTTRYSSCPVDLVEMLTTLA